MKNKFYKNFDFNKADRLIRSALKEDIGKGDITSEILIDPQNRSYAEILVKDEGVIAGLEIFKRVFEIINERVQVRFYINEGDSVKKGSIAGYVKGDTRSILKGERTALNLLQHMSGIATKTRKFIEQLGNKKTKIIDTRKTTPNLRIFEKLAVKIGGGENHRFGLFDMMLVKDNHIASNGGIKNTLRIIKKKKKRIKSKIEIEVQNLEELRTVIDGGKGIIDIVMLDNFHIPEIKKAEKLINKKFKIEISGGIGENTISKFKSINGIDYISIGALTHSVKALDISLDFISPPLK